MVDYREILRLRSLGNNITQIANAVHSSRHTVRDVEKLADERSITWPLKTEITNQQLYRLFYPERQAKAQVYLEPDCAYIHAELAKKGVNLTLLWNAKQDLLIIDEWLLRPLPEMETYDLLEIVEACVQKGALIICTQYDTDDWYYRIDCDRAEDEKSPVT